MTSRRGAPLGYDKPTRRRDRADSHFCRPVGSTVFVGRESCPYCQDKPQEVDTNE